MDSLIESFAREPGLLIPIIAITGGLTIGAIGILSSMVTDMVKVRQREESRREIAAYIAEGSMTPEEGERVLNAGRKGKKGKSC